MSHEVAPAQTIGPFTVLGRLGSGAYGVVYRAEHARIQTQVAIKAIPKRQVDTPNDIAILEREIDLLKSLDHPFIPTLYDVRQDDEHHYIVQELADGGDLLDYINARRGLSEAESRRIFCQLLQVLDYLHSVKHVAHRDIKAENVLLDRNTHIRLVDFGLSKTFSKVNPFLHTPCGSPAYVAPEIIRHETYSTAADIWSAGILLYAMTAGTLPFYNENTGIMLNDILTNPPPICLTMSQDLRDVLSLCLVKDPEQRGTLQQIRDSKWLADHQNPKLCKEDEVALASLRVCDLDLGLLEEMQQLGFDVSKLRDDLKNEVVNEVTASYRMIRREQLIDQINIWQIQRAKRMGQLKSEQRIRLAEASRQSRSTEPYLMRPDIGWKMMLPKRGEPIPMARLPFGRRGGLMGRPKRGPSPVPMIGARANSPLPSMW
jgi:serine/threonine protein kinase